MAWSDRYEEQAATWRRVAQNRASAMDMELAEEALACARTYDRLAQRAREHEARVDLGLSHRRHHPRPDQP